MKHSLMVEQLGLEQTYVLSHSLSPREVPSCVTCPCSPLCHNRLRWRQWLGRGLAGTVHPHCQWLIVNTQLSGLWWQSLFPTHSKTLRCRIPIWHGLVKGSWQFMNTCQVSTWCPLLPFRCDCLHLILVILHKSESLRGTTTKSNLCEDSTRRSSPNVCWSCQIRFLRESLSPSRSVSAAKQFNGIPHSWPVSFRHLYNWLKGTIFVRVLWTSTTSGLPWEWPKVDKSLSTVHKVPGICSIQIAKCPLKTVLDTFCNIII